MGYQLAAFQYLFWEPRYTNVHQPVPFEEPLVQKSAQLEK